MIYSGCNTELPVSPDLSISLFVYAASVISFVGGNSYEDTSSGGCFKTF